MAKDEKAAPAVIEDDESHPFSADEANEPKLEAKDVVLEVPKGESEPEPAPVDPGVAELKRQLETKEAELRERNAQIEAERNQRIQAERQSGVISVAMVDQAMEAAKNYRGQLRSQFIAAQTAGNYEAAADVQIAISQNEANLLALQQQKQQVEAYNAQPQPQRQIAPQQEMDRPSQIAENLAKGGFQKSAEWIKANRHLVSDQRGINRVEAADKYAVEIKGLVRESPEYFAKLEEELGIRQPERDPEPPPPRVVRTPAAAAPVSGRTPSLSGQGRPGTVRLTPEQRDHAHNILGMTDEEYAAAISDPGVQKRLLGTR